MATSIEKFLKLTLRPKTGFSTDPYYFLHRLGSQVKHVRAQQAVMWAKDSNAGAPQLEDADKTTSQHSTKKNKNNSLAKYLIHKKPEQMLTC